jgi:membrane-associated phospholipid phosphatase
MTYLPPYPNRFTWAMLIALGALTACLGIYQGFSVDSRSVIIGTAILVVMLALAHFYTAWRHEPQFACPTVIVAYFVANALVFGPLSYFIISFNMPLYDQHLAGLDQLTGFDWRALQHWTASSWYVSVAALRIYFTSGSQLFLVYIVLSLTGQFRRLSVFMTAMVIATALCLLCAGLFPAVGAYTYWDMQPADFGYLKATRAGTYYVHDFQAVRDGTMRALDLSKLEGIIQFPSFHTVVALMCAWAFYETRRARIPAILFSSIVVVTTLPIGGHHLADVVAGAVVALIAVTAAWRVESPEGVNTNTLAARAPAEGDTVAASA